MVNEKLSVSHERSKERYESFLDEIKRGEFIIKCGNIIFIISIIMIFLSAFLKIDINNFIGNGIVLGFFSGFIIIIVGEIFRKRGEEKIHFPIEEAYFLSICKSLEDIKCYQKNDIKSNEYIKLKRLKAAERLTEFEKQIREPEWKGGLWEKLTEEENKNLNILKRNINELLIPSITQDYEEEVEEEVKKAYSVMEKLAQYLLSPTISELINLNKSMSELKIDIPKKPSFRPNFFHPYMVHTYVFVIICAISYSAYHLGIYINASIDTAYSGTIGLFGVLLLAYINFMIKK